MGTLASWPIVVNIYATTGNQNENLNTSFFFGGGGYDDFTYRGPTLYGAANF